MKKLTNRSRVSSIKVILIRTLYERLICINKFHRAHRKPQHENLWRWFRGFLIIILVKNGYRERNIRILLVDIIPFRGFSTRNKFSDVIKSYQKNKKIYVKFCLNCSNCIGIFLHEPRQIFLATNKYPSFNQSRRSWNAMK